MGLGYSRGKFKINNISQSDFTTTDINSQILTLCLNTRLRLKANNRLQKKSPDFSLLMKSLLGRLKTLQHSYSNTPVNELLYHQLLQQAKTMPTIQSTVYWDDWDRYSGNQKEWMKFGGLQGEISFQGDLLAFIPYLQMGEWTHIGGKSSFGLGKYSIIYEETNEK